jgi:hypothetical protein
VALIDVLNTPDPAVKVCAESDGEVKLDPVIPVTVVKSVFVLLIISIPLLLKRFVALIADELKEVKTCGCVLI